jgi:Zn-dependent oligopeptidase
MESALLPMHLLNSPPGTITSIDTFETCSDLTSPMDHPISIVENGTPITLDSKATPTSQPRSLRRSSRRTATSSTRLEKARKLFQEAEETLSPPPASSVKEQAENAVKDFALDYDSSGAEPMKESRSQLLVKQRKGQVFGNSQLEQDVSLPKGI